jgi:hypothetical protein
MNRQFLLLCCFLTVILLVLVNAHPSVTGADQQVVAAVQVSPLLSPLASPLRTTVQLSTTVPSSAAVPLSTTVQTQAIPTASPGAPLMGTSGSPVSLVLVGAVLVGLLAMIGLVIGRQR